MFENVPDIVILNNALALWLKAFIWLGAGCLVIKIYAVVVAGRLRRLASENPGGGYGLLVELLDRLVTPVLISGSLYLITQILALPAWSEKLASWFFIIVVTWTGARALLHFIDGVALHLCSRDPAGKEPVDHHAVHNVSLVAKASVWILAFFLVITNLGYNATSLLTGLGISGIAIALAVQNILGDLFSYVSIIIDKPFVIGDFIIAGNHMGTVERIGIKSTRLKTADGMELVISNADLTSSRVLNLRSAQERRITFTVGVVYGTSSELLKRMPEIVREAFAKVNGARLDRVHFKALSSSSLDFEISYLFESKIFHDYLDLQEQINLEIYDRLRSAGVEFAFPTQTVHLPGVRHAQ